MSKCYYCGGRGRGCPECKRVVEARTMTGEFSPENQAGTRAGGKNEFLRSNGTVTPVWVNTLQKDLESIERNPSSADRKPLERVLGEPDRNARRAYGLGDALLDQLDKRPMDIMEWGRQVATEVGKLDHRIRIELQRGPSDNVLYSRTEVKEEPPATRQRVMGWNLRERSKSSAQVMARYIVGYWQSRREVLAQQRGGKIYCERHGMVMPRGELCSVCSPEPSRLAAVPPVEGAIRGNCPSHGEYLATNAAGCPDCLPSGLRKLENMAKAWNGTWEDLEPNSYYADDSFNDTWTYADPQHVKSEFSLEQLKATMDQLNREVPVQPDPKPWKKLVLFGGDPFAADPLQKLAEQIAMYNAARREEAFLAFYSGLIIDKKD